MYICLKELLLLSFHFETIDSLIKLSFTARSNMLYISHFCIFLAYDFTT